MRRLPLSLVLALGALLSGVALPLAVAQVSPAPGAVELKVVKYRDLIAAVRAQAGKVVVVDIWGVNCKPCKEEFPHLVELHRRHAGQGLVCISVSIDPNEPEKRDKALQFLQAQGATFPNFLLDEVTDVWQAKWNINGYPAVFVFDRNGKRAAKFDNDDPEKQFDYKSNVAPLVEKLLQER